MSMDDEEAKRGVGYKRPPAEHQFKKGQPSPNPKGRPRKDKAYQRVVLEALNRKLTITVNGKRRKLSVTEVALQQLGNKAGAGDLNAIKEINKLNQQVAPLKPQPEMSSEELRQREQNTATLSALLIEALNRKAQEKKTAGAPRGGLTPPAPEERSGEGN